MNVILKADTWNFLNLMVDKSIKQNIKIDEALPKYKNFEIKNSNNNKIGYIFNRGIDKFNAINNRLLQLQVLIYNP